MPRIDQLLDSLESFYGVLFPIAPTEPYEFLVWWHCGYPASEERCAKGWQTLRTRIGIAPMELISASTAKLVAALKTGGMVPELRAARLKEIAARVEQEFGGELRSALSRLSLPQVRKTLKTFPGIGNPGADRISLFANLSPVAAVPSACPHVLVRLKHGPEGDKYARTYAAAQRMLETLPATFEARTRGYLLINRHARELCKRTRPACERCPLRSECAFARRSLKP
jgi:A/G-specific adenine glycosylase